MAKKWVTENLKKLNKVLAITVKPVLMATSKQRPPVNNDWSDPQSAKVYFMITPWITATFEQRPVFLVSRLAVVHRFDCIFFIKKLFYNLYYN